MGSETRRAGVGTAQVFAYAAVAMAAAAVIGGILLVGSPAEERKRQIDQRRVNDLESIAAGVDSYHAQRGTLPGSLEVLQSGGTTYFVGSIADPETGAPYEYRATGETTYELCATFSMSSTDTSTDGPRPVMDPYAKPLGWRSWDHGVGRTCFELDAAQRLDFTACTITTPCAAGQSCVTLPGREGSVCVPAGRECEAAKCSGQCTIAESYPAQVRCTEPGSVSPEPDGPVSSGDCQLMRDRNTGRMGCFGCAGTVCTTPARGYEPYEPDPDAVGIPYACYATMDGCQLAQ